MFYISETTNVNATRETTAINVDSLSKAKRAATKSQCFFGTVLKIEDDNGLVAYKDQGKWHNA